MSEWESAVLRKEENENPRHSDSQVEEKRKKQNSKRRCMVCGTPGFS